MKQTLTEACEEAERTDPVVAAAAASYDEMVQSVLFQARVRARA